MGLPHDHILCMKGYVEALKQRGHEAELLTVTSDEMKPLLLQWHTHAHEFAFKGDDQAPPFDPSSVPSVEDGATYVVGFLLAFRPILDAFNSGATTSTHISVITLTYQVFSFHGVPLISLICDMEKETSELE